MALRDLPLHQCRPEDRLVFYAGYAMDFNGNPPDDIEIRSNVDYDEVQEDPEYEGDEVDDPFPARFAIYRRYEEKMKASPNKKDE